MGEPPRKYPVIVGATASGKSDVAVEVALRLGVLGRPGEIVTADSVQIYRGMDIGSAKPTLAQRRGVPHHLIDVVDPAEPFTVSDWLNRARALIAEITTRGHVPVVVGGTHLYVMALVYGLFEGPGADENLRLSLAAMPPAALRAELEQVDPAAAERIHPNDQRRTIRALEVWRLTGRSISDWQQEWNVEAGGGEDPKPCVAGLLWSNEALAARINDRVDQMMRSGLEAEVRGLWEGDQLGPQAREALGYKQLIRHMIGGCTLNEAVGEIKQQTRRFAKNQRTWMRRLRENPGSTWIEAEGQGPDQIAQVIAQQCFV
jgi:tRNA dimethylallyltransferase